MNNIAAAYTACDGKGAIMPTAQNSANLADTIDSISQVMNRIHGEDSSTSFEHLGKLEKHLQELSLFHNKYLDPYDFSGKRILVAEGMEINREIAREMLRQTGAVTEFAVDGQDCLEKVMSKPADYYDLILMEFRMRKMDGIETTKRIRALEDEKKAYLYIHDLAILGNAHVTVQGGGVGFKHFTNVKKKVKSVKWGDNGQELDFVQHGDHLWVNASGFPYGCQYVVRIADVEFED